MELRTLRYFVGIVEAGSLSRAASSLYVAQPALSAQIKKLEGELHAKLLDRSHSGVIPTAAGRQLYEDACQLLSDAEAVRDRVRRLPDGPEGSVTVAVPFLVATALMGPVLMRLRSTYPRIRIFVRDGPNEIVKQTLLDGRADLGILMDTPHLDGFDCRPLAQGSIYFCGRDMTGSVAKLLRHTVGEGKVVDRLGHRRPPTIAFAEAATLPLLVRPPRYPVSRRVTDAAAALGIELHAHFEVQSTRTIRSLLAHGAGFCFAPAWSIRAQPGFAPDWIRAEVIDPKLPLVYALVIPARKKPTTATAAVRDAMVDELRKLMEGPGWPNLWIGD